jgi:hypothetical protein
MKKFKVKDSGKRQHFKGGAQRDSGEKPRPDLVSPYALTRVGEHLRKGAEKYDERNWEKGMPFSRLVASAYRHLLEFQKGDTEEDHLSAIIFNIQAIIHFQETGRKELNDL